MMRSRKGALLLLTGALALSGCAYITAKPVPFNGTAEGIPFYAPKAYVLINAQGATPVILPDCSRRYALQIGSFLAKNHSVVEMAEGFVTKVDTNQDTTSIVPELVALAKAAAGAPNGGASGGAMSDIVDANTRFGLYEARCVKPPNSAASHAATVPTTGTVPTDGAGQCTRPPGS
ncbi:MAG: hypothetical protein B7Z08_12400 [Sphingomonadales bacterium 32-68-7]|nr:MAG: hypothetical protein B7Z08_12400 [Sphingomonadales bacterium 32-68-7]